MSKFVTRFAKNESGATAIEYGLIVALIAVVIIGAVTTILISLKSIVPGEDTLKKWSLHIGIAAILLVLWGTFNRNRWGFNFGKLLCPRCLRPIPRPQGVPSLRQLIFGGGTCSECHTVVDKWGRERMPGHRYRVSAKN